MITAGWADNTEQGQEANTRPHPFVGLQQPGPVGERRQLILFGREYYDDYSIRRSVRVRNTARVMRGLAGNNTIHFLRLPVGTRNLFN